jgi:hypothetical protein
MGPAVIEPLEEDSAEVLERAILYGAEVKALEGKFSFGKSFVNFVFLVPLIIFGSWVTGF